MTRRLPKFIEDVYNRPRLHSALGYRSPVESDFELVQQATWIYGSPFVIGRASMKKQIGVAAAVGAVLLAAGWTGYVQAQRTDPQRPAWQYRIDVTSDRTQRVDIAAENQRILDTRAAEGWELAAVGNGFFYFRRPK